MQRVCYANPTILLRRPISELLSQQAGKRRLGLLIPERARGRHDDSLHHSTLPKSVHVHTYATRQLPGSPFEWPLPGLGFLRQAWRVLRDYDVVHVWAHFYLSTLLLLLLSRCTRTRIILTMDTIPGYSFSLGPLWDVAFKLYTWTVGRIVYGVPETITLYGEALVPHALRSGIGREKLRVLPTGITPHRTPDARRTGKQVLYAGLLNRRKGVDAVLAVARRVPEAQFLIAGDGPDRKRLEQEAPENVRFLGWRKDLPALLAASTLFLFPSRAEGLPGVVMEAMQCGTPVVTTRIPCTTDLVTHGETGLLADPDDIASLTRHVKRLLGDKRLGRRLATQAAAHLEQYSWKRVLPRYAALYDERPVAHVITGLGVGGAERMLLKTLPHLSGTHVACSLTDDDAVGRDLAASGVEVCHLRLRWWNGPLVAWRLWRYLRSRRPRIVNSYLLHANLLARFVGRAAGVQRIICSVRNIHRDRPFWNTLDRLTQRLVTRYTPNSSAVAAWLTDEVGIPKQKVTVIPNCIDEHGFRNAMAKADKAALRKELGLKRERVVLCVASFKAQKAHDILLRAFAELPGDWTLLLAGDGPQRGGRERLARQLKIARRVRFLGNRDDIPGLLAIADLFVLPSRHEGMPNVLLEAMAARIPLVCSDIPENREVADGQATFVPVGDVSALAAGMQAAAKHPRLPAEYRLEKCLTHLEKLYAHTGHTSRSA